MKLRHILYKTAFLCCLSTMIQAQVFYNNGAAVTINAGEIVTVYGSLENSSFGTIDNKGTVYVSKSWINHNPTGLVPNTGTVNLNGANQDISGSQPTTFFNLTLSGTANSIKTLNINTIVNGKLDLNNQQLSLKEKTIEITNSTTTAITRSAGGHIKSETTTAVSANTANNKSIIKWSMTAAANTYEFPFGNGFTDATDYLPLIFSKQATASNILGEISTNSTGNDNKPWSDRTSPVGTGSTAPVTALAKNPKSYIIDRWWDIHTNNPVTADLTFTYSSKENTLDPVIQTGTMLAQRWNGASWDNPVGTGTGVIAGKGTVVVNGVTKFSPYTIVAGCPKYPLVVSPDVAICAGNSTALTVSGATSYEWSPATGLSGTTGSSLTATPTVTTKYYVTGTVGSCTELDSVTVTVKPLPVATPTNDGPVCFGGSLQLSANTIAGATYQWTGPSGFNSTVQNPVISPVAVSHSGNYSLVITSNGCTGNAVTNKVIVNSPPVVQSIVANCNAQNTQYTVSVTLSGGTGNYTESGSSFPGNTWTSGLIPSGNNYSFSFDDNNKCGPVAVSGVKNCNCLTKAGTLKPIPLLCEGMSVQAQHNKDSVNDGNDTLQYVLHTGGVPPAITVIDANNTGLFSEPAGAYPKTYYITAIVGNKEAGSGAVDENDGCYTYTDNVPVTWHQSPTLTATHTDTLCPGGNATVTLKLSGSQSPFDVIIDGGRQTLAGISDGHSFNLTVNADTTFNFTSIQYSNTPKCPQTISVPVKIKTWSSPVAQNIQFTCNATADQYQVSFTITGGDANSYTVNSAPSTSAFTSPWIATGGNYSFTINDKNNCNSQTISGTHSCNCTSDAGTPLNTNSIDVCEDLSATYPHSADQVLDGNDTLEYLLHDGSATTIGTILLRSTSPTFNFGSPLLYNTTYYITPVAGNKTGNQVDPNDPCYDVGIGIPVTFRELPDLTVTAVPNDSLCIGDAAELQFNFTGIGPFDVVGTVSQNGMNSGDKISLGNLNTTISYTFTKVTGLYCSKDINKSVTITLPQPFAVSSVFTGISCMGLSDGGIAATVSGGFGGNQYVWENSSQDTISITSAASNLVKGNYSLTISDYLGCTQTENYTLTEPPLYGFTFLQLFNETCYQSSNGELRVGAPDGNFYKFSNTGTGQSVDSIPIDSFLVSLHFNPGTNLLTITVESKNGCTADSTIDMEGLYPITLSRTPDQLICPGSTINLQAGSTGGNGGFKYFWNGLEEGDIKTVSPTSTTTYEIYALDDKGCPSIRDTITITLPVALTQIVSPDKDLCFGDPLVLNTSATGGTGSYSYSWKDLQNNTVSITDSYSTTAQASGTYTITTTDTCGTTVTNTIKVNVAQPVQMDFTALPDTEGCVPLTVTFTNQSVGTYHSGQWKVNGIAESTSLVDFTRVFTKAGTYDVSYHLTDTKAGCNYSLEKKAYIAAYDNAVAAYNYQPLEVTLLDPTINVFNQSIAASSYRWTLDGTEISTLRQPQVNFPKETQGEYLLCLEAINPAGCNDTECQTIIVTDEVTLYIPTSFTPNNDSYNEVFKAVGGGIDTRDFLLQVFDRWGTMLFESKDINEGWDGTYKGELVKSDVYGWKIRVRVKGESGKVERTGKVVVMR